MTTNEQVGQQKPEYSSGYAPVANLWVAAADVLKAYDTLGPTDFAFKITREMTALREALAQIKAAREEANALDDVTQEANGYRLGEDGDVDIIGDWTHHNGEPAGEGGGHWVDAWVWVPDAEPDESEADEVVAEKAARAKGWVRGGDGEGIIYNTNNYESWKAAVSMSPEEGAIYDSWVECCDAENIEYEES